MDFPAWAPAILVSEYEKRLDSKPRKTDESMMDPEEYVSYFFKDRKRRPTKKNLEVIRRRAYRQEGRGLPNKESIALLAVLITDLRMKPVWIALKKRLITDSDLFDFYIACERGIACWRGDQKQTISERKAFYSDISETGVKLLTLMREASMFDDYELHQLLTKKDLKALLGDLESPYKDDVSEDSFAFLCIFDSIPSIVEILIDIVKKARKHAEEESPIKRPKGWNAEVNYFIRYLSTYFQGRYHTPLHQAVAVTTSVIFDDVNIDSDHVRHIVKT